MTDTFLLIGAMTLGTVLTRFLPFWIFPPDKPTPRYVTYLGDVLPCAVIGMLVVYCLKGIQWTVSPYGIPEILAVALTAGLHLWKRNTLLSIGCGTAAYMALMQFIF